MVRAVHAEGTDVYVELGAGDNRAAAVKDILGEKGASHVSVAFDKKGQKAWGRCSASRRR